MTTQQAPTWTGAERRSGTERRSSTIAWRPERRSGERRRGGVGSHRPNPLEELFDGIEPTRPEAFVPAAGGASSLRERLMPEHEPHDAIPSLAAIAGHPVHPMLVPLPIGSFVGALVADLAYSASGDPFFARAGRLLTGAAVVTGAVAGVAGAIDFVGRPRIRSHPSAWFHGSGNAAALGIGLASLAVRRRRSSRLHDASGSAGRTGLAMSLAAAGVLLVTGWLGGELSYRHRVGVTAQPERPGGTGRDLVG